MRLLTRATAALPACVLLVACGAGSDSTDPTSKTTEAGTVASESAKVDSSPKAFNASGLLGGDATPSLPDGEAGKISVVAQAPLDKSKYLESATLSFAFRNNTDETVGYVDWTATARVDGKIVATGSSQGTQPARLEPGEIGLGFIYFETGGEITKGAAYEFTPSPRSTDIDFMAIVPLEVTEANRVSDGIVGSAVNKTDVPLDGPFSSEVYCFDGNDLIGQTGSFAEENGPIPPASAVHFTVDIPEKCKQFAIGVSGFANPE